MKIDRLILGEYETNCYILRQSDTAKDCLIIDAGLEADRLINFLKENLLFLKRKENSRNTVFQRLKISFTSEIFSKTLGEKDWENQKAYHFLILLTVITTTF